MHAAATERGASMSTMEQLEADVSRLQDLFRLGSDELPGETSKFINDHAASVSAQQEAVLAMAVAKFNQGELYAAEQLCRLILQSSGKEFKALHLLATIATRLGHHEDAADLLLDCLDVNPYLPFVRYELADAFFRSGRFQPALELSNELIGYDSGNIEYASLRAASLVKLGQYENATHQYEDILKFSPDDGQILLRYGIALRIVGRAAEAIDAFRAVIEREPHNGEAYWNLANLKTFNFDALDIDAMRAALGSDQLKVQDRIYFSFALGKAFDDLAEFRGAFQYYSEANELAKSRVSYDPVDTSKLVNRCERVFTHEYFESPRKACDADDPIFIVGLPRSGSTLLEQVLSNHSAIDATMELAEINAMVRSLNNPNRTGIAAQFPGVLKELKAASLEKLGEEYLKRTKCFRGDRRFFIDKAPHNFLHIGLIASILPNARIIDARRNPYACGVSIYQQYFARGTAYAYDLEHIGLYYRDYLRLMNHWHEVLPGRILTVYYEDVVADMETQVRRIFDFLQLGFEAQCLEFYKSRRPVATVSSEQVRQPVYDSSLEHWRNYEKYLDPLKNALGDTDYRQ